MDSRIAIVGMACRYAGANSLSAFWDLLSRGGSGISMVPKDRWQSDNQQLQRAGTLSDPWDFDAAYFGI